MFQRSQHLMARAAASWTVYFLEEPLIDERLAGPPGFGLARDTSGVFVANPKLPTGCSESAATLFQKWCLDSILDRHPGRQTIFWYETPLALRFSLHREPDLCVYDVGETVAFSAHNPDWTTFEGKLFDIADLVFADGTAVYDAKKAFHSRVYSFPSRAYRAHIEAARTYQGPEPERLATIAHPRIGYFGPVDHRLDLPLVAALAREAPSWQFVMLGRIAIDERLRPGAPNLHWLGSIANLDLPCHLASWDYGFMPLAPGDSEPTNVTEYLAAGLPLVASPVRSIVRDWRRLGLVEIAFGSADFAAKIRRGLSASQEERLAWLARVDQKLATQTWDETWQAMQRLMKLELSWETRWREISRILNQLPAEDHPASRLQDHQLKNGQT